MPSPEHSLEDSDLDSAGRGRVQVHHQSDIGLAAARHRQSEAVSKYVHQSQFSEVHAPTKQVRWGMTDHSDSLHEFIMAEDDLHEKAKKVRMMSEDEAIEVSVYRRMLNEKIEELRRELEQLKPRSARQRRCRSKLHKVERLLDAVRYSDARKERERRSQKEKQESAERRRKAIVDEENEATCEPWERVASSARSDEFGTPFLRTDPNHMAELMEALGEKDWNLKGNERQRAVEWLRSRAHVFARDPKDPGISLLPPMKIEVDGPPPKSMPYRTNPRNKMFIQETIAKLLNTGKISPNEGPYGAPVIVVRNPTSGKLRMCVDYRRLNKITKTDAFPLPTIEDVLSMMGGKKYFSTFDLCQGYHQVRVDDQDKEKTAMVTHMGTFEWNVVGFGLKNAPAHFTRCMDVVLSGLNWRKCCVFVDDVIVFSNTFEQHLEDLSEVVDRFEKHKLSLHPNKCQLFKDKVTYLGYTISAAGVDALSAKVEAIEKIPPAQTMTELRSFIYMVGFYRRLIKNFAKRAEPLTRLLKKENWPFKPWEKGSEQEKAYEDLRVALKNTVTLHHIDYTKPFVIDVDACKKGLGAVLCQEVELPISGGTQGGTTKTQKFLMPCYFASRTLKGTEQNQTPMRLEATGVLWALEYFQNFILGNQVTVYTDHGPLDWLFRPEHKNSPLIRFQARYQEFEPYTKVVYRPGRLHSVPDALSRLVVEDMSTDAVNLETHLAPDERYVSALTRGGQLYQMYEDKLSEAGPQTWSKPLEDTLTDSTFLKKVRQEQPRDEIFGPLRLVLAGKASEIDVKKRDSVEHRARHFRIEEGLLYRRYWKKMADGTRRKISQLCVPKSLREFVLTKLHDHPTSAHIGREKMEDLVSSRFYWPKYYEDVARWVKSCPLCQRFLGLKPRKVGVLQPKNIQDAMHTLSIDLFGPLPSSSGKKYILTIIDCFTRWPTLVAIGRKDAQTVADAIHDNTFFDHACVRRIVHDGGGEFANDVFARYCARFGIEDACTTPYHPQSNAQAERIHRFIKKSLAVLTYQKPKSWVKMLDYVAFAYRTTKLHGIGYSPYFLLYGREPVLPVDVLTSSPLALQVDAAQYGLKQSALLHETWQQTRKIQAELNLKATSEYDSKRKAGALEAGSKVLRYMPPHDEGCHKLSAYWHGPYEVVSRSARSPNVYTIRDENGTILKAHVSNLLPYLDRREPYYGPPTVANDQDDRVLLQAGERIEPLPRAEPRSAIGEVLEGDEEKTSDETDHEPEDDPEPNFHGVYEDAQHAEEIWSEMSHAKQVKTVKEAIEVINSTNNIVFIAKSTIPGMPRGKDYGVFIRKGCKAWTVIGTYRGESLTREEYERRYPTKYSGTYVFQISDDMFVDGSDPTLSGFGRFLNCCGVDETPNVEVAEINGQLYIIANREIAAGEELLYDYGDSFNWKDGERRKGTKVVTVVPEHSGSDVANMMPDAFVAENRRTELSDDQDRMKKASIASRESDTMLEEENKMFSRPEVIPDVSKPSLEEKQDDHFERDSWLIYKDETGTMPWLIGQIYCQDPDNGLIETTRYGSYAMHRDPNSDIRTWVFKPAWREVKTDKLVYTDSPAKHLKANPERDVVYLKNVVVRNFYLTNKGRIPIAALREADATFDLLNVQDE